MRFGWELLESGAVRKGDEPGGQSGGRVDGAQGGDTARPPSDRCAEGPAGLAGGKVEGEKPGRDSGGVRPEGTSLEGLEAQEGVAGNPLPEDVILERQGMSHQVAFGFDPFGQQGGDLCQPGGPCRIRPGSQLDANFQELWMAGGRLRVPSGGEPQASEGGRVGLSLTVQGDGRGERVRDVLRQAFEGPGQGSPGGHDGNWVGGRWGHGSSWGWLDALL